MINFFPEVLSVLENTRTRLNKLARVSVNSPQKKQDSACFRLILKRKSFVAIHL